MIILGTTTDTGPGNEWGTGDTPGAVPEVSTISNDTLKWAVGIGGALSLAAVIFLITYPEA